MTLAGEKPCDEASPAVQLSPAVTTPISRMERLVAAQKRQAAEVVAEMVRMRGFMPLLMKHRNGQLWTAEERTELLTQLRILSRLSPYLLFLLLPGSALLLPGYAWWLDRRRNPRNKITKAKRVKPAPDSPDS